MCKIVVHIIGKKFKKGGTLVYNFFTYENQNLTFCIVDFNGDVLL